jgi:hypothetical protein
MLLEEFLIPMKLTQRQLTDGIHVPYQRSMILSMGGVESLPARLYVWQSFLECRRISG